LRFEDLYPVAWTPTLLPFRWVILRMPDISSRPTSRNGWTLPEAVTSARLLGIVASSRVSRQILNSRASSVPPGAPPRRPPYFGPSRAARVPRVASEGIVAMIVDAHGCTSARWYRGTTCCRGRSSAPPGSLAPSPWGRASGSLQGRVRPCSCSPPLVTSSSILKVSARSPSEPCEIYSRLITMSGRARARVRCGPREQRERDRADELEYFYHKSQRLGSAHSIFSKAPGGAARTAQGGQQAQSISLGDATLRAVRAHPNGASYDALFKHLSRKFGMTVRPNHLGGALHRHQRAGRLENRDQRWYLPR